MENARRLQPDHFEYRYQVPEGALLRVRDFIGQHLELDPNSVGCPDFSYPVHSFYFDSDDWRLYWRAVRMNANTEFLRLRTYSDHPDKPVYFELKRRAENLVQKKSVPVNRARLQSLLAAGGVPEAGDLPNPKQAPALQRMTRIVLEHQARPLVHVVFMREAWIKPDDSRIRLTLDRQVRCERVNEFDPSGDLKNSVPVYGKKVLLEIKFTDRFPNWFKDLAASARLAPSGSIKYLDSVKLIGGPAVTGSDTTVF